jgi:signal transduction histidine kinase
VSRRSVVVVDDLAELRQILRLVLEHGGPFRVVAEGRNGHDAIALAAEHHPDLLVMDVEMPGGPSGWEVLARIGEVAPETVTVILSGSRGQRRPEGGPEPAAVLEKGLPPRELNAALVALLGATDDGAASAPAPADDALASAATRIERQERDLRRTTAELDSFASVAGHDLAQPLQVAYGYLEMLRADYGEGLDPTAAEWLEAAIGSLDRMRGLVQALLVFARAGGRPPVVVPADLDAAVDEAVRRVEPALTAAGGRIERGRLPVVDADAAQLVDVLAALVDNAIRFAAPGEPPTITISAGEADDAWTVTVADDGPGFAAGVADRAFEAFQRSPSPSGRGPGLGLATCRKLVEAHGGRIWLDDGAGTDQAAAGAAIHFTLPRRRSDVRPV